MPAPENVPPSDSARLKRKNRVILAALLAFAALIWAVTIIRLKG